LHPPVSPTINSATGPGKKKRSGSIAKGKYTDIIAIKDKPLEDISILENVDVLVRQ
jgi:imidazolonepropionase-like amidohydrolase